MRMGRSLKDLLRFWFTSREPVSRATYLRHGVLLAAVKYAVDAAVIYALTRGVWSPLGYMLSSPYALSDRWAGSAPIIAPLLALWTFPFMWIAVSLTMRRLIDMGWSPWLSLMLFIPYLSYALMAGLAFWPSAEPSLHAVHTTPHGPRTASAWLAIGIGTALGLAMILLGIQLRNEYSLMLFMGTPYFVGLATGYAFCRRYPATSRETFWVVMATLFLLGVAAIMVAIEGAVCLIMLAPMAIAIAWMGGENGRYLARRGESSLRGAMLAGVLFPWGVAVEPAPSVALREVQSAVVIDAPADVVWRHVIAFSPIDEPTSPMFRLGLAYPVRARIEGEGVGAVRYCEFSTGVFVEPITVWEPGKRLAFDVVESPAPLKELSPYAIKPPHLDGYLVSRRGEFRLVALADGRTRLEGSTWYEQRLRPEGYWVFFSDYVIGRIHRRVLDHIRSEAEG